MIYDIIDIMVLTNFLTSYNYNNSNKHYITFIFELTLVYNVICFMFSSVQSLSGVRLFATQ